MKIMADFLRSEICSQELYEDIMNYVLSYHIRSGEFVCNEYVIKKMDQVNYIIFAEYVNRDGTQREINKTISVYRDNLLEEINKYAKEQGFNISRYENFKQEYSLELYCYY